MNKKKMRILLALIMVVIVVSIVLLIIGTGRKVEIVEKKVGIMLTGTICDGGWNQMNYDGAKAACDEYGLELIYLENVAEDEESCQSAASRLADEGAQLILLSSYNYADYLMDFIQEHPEIAFYSNSFGHDAPNLSSYMARMYQARYLSGIIAGMKTETGVIGYVAAMNNSEVNRGINAFTMGVRSVNPHAVVKVCWTNSWDNEEREIELTNALVQECGADVITCHQNRTTVPKAADANGVYSIGYNIIADGLSDKYLVAAVFNWKGVYGSILRDFVQGKANENPIHFVGIEEDAIELTGYSKLVTEDIRSAVENATNDIIAGKEIFSGEIYDNEGNLRCTKNEIISDKTLLTNMNWLVEGTEIYEK